MECDFEDSLECLEYYYEMIGGTITDEPDWMEYNVISGFRVWHVLFLCGAGTMILVVAICCCCRIRIPRTKQEIEADYKRNKIVSKFRSKLKTLNNSDLSEMDLKKALEKVRSEFASDTDSVAMSDAAISASLSTNNSHRMGKTGITLENFASDELKDYRKVLKEYHKKHSKSKEFIACLL